MSALVARLLVPGIAVVLAAAGCSGAAPTAPAVPSSPAATAVAVFDGVPPLHPSVDEWEAGAVDVVAADGTVHRVVVRVARTAQQRAHGLMEVPALPDGAGMWFAYDDDRTGGFWMKNTLVPLDIVYVGADDRIVSIADATPCTADPCQVYDPTGPYRNVLEVPGGYLARIGAGVGDIVRFVGD